jgi:hypothetical protein
VKTSHGIVMDGFVKGSSGSGSSQPKIHKITEASNLLLPKAASTSIRSAAQGMHLRAQRSQTLMRTAVKKPTNAIAKAANTQFKQTNFKSRINNVDRPRFDRASVINKNNKVRRFGHGVNPAVIQAKQAPVHQPNQKAVTGEVVSTKTNTAPAAKSSSTSLIHKPLPSMITSASHQQLERLLDEALTRSNSHKRSRHSQVAKQNLLHKIIDAPRWLSVGTAVVVLSLIVGFIAMNKVPHVAVRVAAAKAHVSASLPGYLPSGFGFAGPVSYGSGNVSINFKANDGSNRQFTLSQTSSKMSSKSLEDKVIPANTQVQTSVVNGTTVYIYGQNNDAAWVNNGTQYTIKDSAKLNSDQLLKIANSL